MYHIFNIWHHFFSSSNCISFFIGGMIGGLSGGWLATKVGRKQGLLYNQILSFTGAILSGCAKPADSYEMLIIGESLGSRRRFFFFFKLRNFIKEYHFNHCQVALESELLVVYLLVWFLCTSPRWPLFIFVEVWERSINWQLLQEFCWGLWTFQFSSMVFTPVKKTTNSPQKWVSFYVSFKDNTSL